MPLTEEHKAAMVAGRRAARERKKAAEEAARGADIEDVSFDFADAVRYGPAVEHEEPSSPAVPIDPADSYQLFLASLDGDTVKLLSKAELREIFDTQQKKAADERRVRLRKSAAETALNAARASQGLVAADTQEMIATKRQNGKPVSIMVQLPPAGEEGQISDIGLRIDGKILYHGTKHYCTYGEAASLREIMYRAMEHELLFKGQRMRERQWLMGLANGQYGRHIGDS